MKRKKITYVGLINDVVNKKYAELSVCYRKLVNR